MAAEVLANQDQAEGVNAAECAAGEEEDHGEERDRRGGEREGKGDQQRRNRAKAQKPPAAVPVGEQSEDADKDGFTKTEDRDQFRCAFVAEALCHPEQGQQTVDRSRGNADEE